MLLLLCNLFSCPHCKRTVPRLHRRGLCRRCYEIRSVRHQTPRLNLPQADHVVWYPAMPLPTETTDACPGSEAKIAIMCSRAAASQQLFHPADATFSL